MNAIPSGWAVIDTSVGTPLMIVTYSERGAATLKLVNANREGRTDQENLAAAKALRTADMWFMSLDHFLSVGTARTHEEAVQSVSRVLVRDGFPSYAEWQRQVARCHPADQAAFYSVHKF